MVDVSGIPNMGFGGGGYFGGSASLGLPAMSADQINASMGWNPNAAQFNPWANTPGGFGGQTDYYSSLGAAYGRETGGFGYLPDGTPIGAGGGFGGGGAATSGMPEWQYNQMMKGYGGAYAPGAVQRGSDLPAPDTSSYNPISGNTWGAQPAYNDYGGGANPGGFSPSQNYPGGGWSPSGAASSGMPEWQYNQMMKSGGNPYAGMILGPMGNPSAYNPGSYAGDQNNYGLQYNGQPMPGDIGYSRQPSYPNLGYNPGMSNWFANPGMSGGGFQDRFGMGFPNAGTPSQYYTGSNYGGGGGMPPGFSGRYGVDSPTGALDLWGGGSSGYGSGG